MIKGLNPCHRTSIHRLVGGASRWIMQTEADWPEAVLMPKPDQVSQFMGPNLRRQQNEVLTGRCRLARPDLFVADGAQVRLVLPGIPTFLTDVLRSDHSAKQSIDLHNGRTTVVEISRINFTGQSTGATKVRCTVEVNQGKMSIGNRNLTSVQHNADVKPRSEGVGPPVNRLDSSGNGQTLVRRVHVLAVVRPRIKVQQNPLRGAAGSRSRSTEAVAVSCSGNHVVATVA